MRINTSRFGELTIDPERIILFPDGIIGFGDTRHWVLLRESNSDVVGWLQSVKSPELALPVVTPHQFVPSYPMRFHAHDVAAMSWRSEDEAIVLTVVSRSNNQLTINLRAPLLVNLDRCLGRQLLTSDEQPLKYALTNQVTLTRKSA